MAKKMKTLTIGENTYEVGGEGVGSDIPDYVREEAERVASVVQNHINENTVTFIAISDPHHSTAHIYADQLYDSAKHCGQGAALVKEMVPVDFACLLGDILWAGGETAEQGLDAFREYNGLIADAFSDIPNFRVKGNYESLSDGEDPCTDAQVFANVMAFNKGAEYDPANRLGGYCYRDFEDRKLRVICLNTSEGMTESFNMSTNQLIWLKEALRVDTANGWMTVLLSHHSLNNYSNSGSVMQVLSEATGICCAIHGHSHNFIVDTLDETGISNIAIPNACFYRSNEGKHEEVTYNKTANTAQDTTFCVVSIDLAQGKLYADCYGAGYDREADVYARPASYTNLVPLSESQDSTEPYNGVGYMNDYSITSSDSGIFASRGMVATGFIPYVVPLTGLPDTLYIKGCELGGSGSTSSRVLFYKENKTSRVGPHIEAGLSNPLNLLETYYNVETLGEKYYKLTPLYDDDGGEDCMLVGKVATSGNAMYIRFGLIGSGENLIITRNEPIV